MLTRPNLRAGGAGYAAEKLPMEPQGYPVFQGLHFCGGGLAADFQLILSEIPAGAGGGDAVGADGGEASETAAAAAAAGPVPGSMTWTAPRAAPSRRWPRRGTWRRR